MKKNLTELHENEKYQKKYSLIKRTIKKFVYENAALCDQVFQLQEKIICAKEERNYLAKRLSQYIPPVDKAEQIIISSASSHKTPTMSVKKRETLVDKGKSRSPRAPSAQKRKRTPHATSTEVPPVPIGVPAPPPPPPPIAPSFPMKLGNLTIHSLGEIVSDRPSFHTEDVVYPVGYCSTRIYGSLHDPTRPCVYTCMILDAGTSPLFQISSEIPDEPILSGVNINMVHSQLLMQINMEIGAEVVSTRGRGADFFGLTHPTVLPLLNKMPAIKKCVGYKGKDMLLDEGGASVKYENLQRSIMFTNSQLETIRQQEILDSTATLRDLLNS